ncbi:MAG TPA: hypothetical protein VH109_07430 [Steroidobacteraceae bacterium]|jgi:hypothetical protein|nr:hypothetical protein [Steroidobacteraceae bacterium]
MPPTLNELNKTDKSRTTKTRAPTTIEITIVADEANNTIYATPNNGNVFVGIPGDVIVWRCDQAFSIQFFELTGSGATLNSKSCEDGKKQFSVKLEEECTFFKYMVTVGNLVLDPYIGTDH